jgi:LacI family transcriptional regulator, repressor for deo operon, udp, cdd, tsx, nupC, and nupG
VEPLAMSSNPRSRAADGGADQAAVSRGAVSRRGTNLRDVARRAGVSAATASRSLRGDASVAAPTRDRVLRAASELGYNLPRAPDRPPLVGVLARFPTQWFFAEAIAGIEQTLAICDHRLVLHNIGDPASRRRFFERVVPLGQLDALVIVSSSFDDIERAALDRLGVPTTVVGGYAPGLPRVGIDDEAAARIATQHLMGLGHRDIGLISFAPDDLVGRDTTAARRRGFESAVSDGGLRVAPEWIIAAHGSRMAGGVRAAEELLTLPKLPTALFAMSDELAIGALRTLRRAGIPVPGQMSIVGFDNHEMAEFVDLTTIFQPVRQQAERATKLLLGQLNNRNVEAFNTDLPVRLIVRGTTGPVR